LFGLVFGGPSHTVPDKVYQLHVQTTFHLWKTRGCHCSFRLLMRGGVSPETCWASYKYRIIKILILFAFCWIFFMNCTITHESTNVKFKNGKKENVERMRVPRNSRT
jgi:hypothetical protein